MTSILNATQYPSPVPNEWQTFLESVTVNGRTLTGHGVSNVSDFFHDSLNLSIPENNTVVLFDTGTGLSLLLYLSPHDAHELTST